MAPDAALDALRGELRAYPNVREPAGPVDTAALLFVPLVLRVPDAGELRFFSSAWT